MKLTQKTIQILKNFSSLNKSIKFYAGNTLRTIVPVSKSVFAVAKIDEFIPKEFSIYDLKSLINAISVLGEPDIEFGERSLTLTSDNRKFELFYAADNTITIAPNNTPKFDSPLLSFRLKDHQQKELITSLGILGLDSLSIIGDDTGIYFVVAKVSDDSSNSYRIRVAESIGKNLQFIIKADNMKLLSSDYMVNVYDTPKGACVEFSSEDVRYFIAVEAKSKRVY